MQILGSVISIVLALSTIIITLVYVISPKVPEAQKLSPIWVRLWTHMGRRVLRLISTSI